MPRQPVVPARPSHQPRRERVRLRRRPSIVCAVAGLEQAEHPVTVARELAERLRDELVLVHVAIPSPPIWDGGLHAGPYPPVEPSHLAAAADSVLDSVVEQLNLEEVTRRTLVGDPATAVVSVADELDADLIVVGSSRHGPFVSALLGSVSRAIADATERPVVVVPSTGPRPHVTPVRCVVCGVDGSMESQRAIRAARDLADRLQARLVLAAAQVSLEEGQRLLQRLIEAEGLPPDTGLSVRFGSPADVLRQVACDEDAALIVVGRSGGLLSDLLHGSVSAALYAHADRIVVLA